MTDTDNMGKERWQNNPLVHINHSGPVPADARALAKAVVSSKSKECHLPQPRGLGMSEKGLVDYWRAQTHTG
jgi:hypothetical protein